MELESVFKMESLESDTFLAKDSHFGPEHDSFTLIDDFDNGKDSSQEIAVRSCLLPKRLVEWNGFCTRQVNGQNGLTKNRHNILQDKKAEYQAARKGV